MSRYELLSLVAAAVALLISLAVLRLRRPADGKQRKFRNRRAARADTQDRSALAEGEQWKPAELRAELVGANGERRFVFTNAGPGIARNVSFAFADVGGWSPPVILAQFQEIFPIREFRPHQQHTCIAALHLAHPPVFTGVYSWEDEDGVRHRTTCRIPL